GVLVALWGISVLLELSPRNLIRVPDVSLDGWILLYTFGVSAVTGIAFGLAPAIVVNRMSPAQPLQTFSRSIAKSARIRRGLVVAQVALAVILLCGAGLLVRSFSALSSVATGVSPNEVLTMQITMPPARYNRNRQVEFVSNIVQRIEQLPGVQSAGATRSLPVIGPTAGTSVQFKGEPEAAPMDRPSTRVRLATPGYFKTLACRSSAGGN